MPSASWPSARPDCVLLDLHLPDANGMDALDRIAKRDATVPIVVLTGLNDEYFGASAVAAGTQDYLVKGRVEPDMLRRALLYAIERKRVELIAADLYASQLRARQNALLERGLLPSPLLPDNPGVEGRSTSSSFRSSSFRASERQRWRARPKIYRYGRPRPAGDRWPRRRSSSNAQVCGSTS